ncbi:MAG: trehalose-6-phosphate synthase [Steroidobacteraceae bacterium]
MDQRIRWLRTLLTRFLLPVAVASTVIAFVGVPLLDRTLSDWFRADVEMRARLVMNSIDAPLAGLLQAGSRANLESYLTRLASDERLLGVLICDARGARIVSTSAWPGEIGCSPGTVADSAVRVLQVGSGWVEVSEFPLASPALGPMRVLLAHDLSFIGRRQSTARRYLLAFAVVALAVLALLVGLGMRILLHRWVRLLVGDIRSRRFLDDAQSPPEAQPVLSRVRAVLRELEANQRLEIDFRENWTPQALQQVVREQLDAAPIMIVSNREPYIHNVGADGRPTVQVPASGMVTALEPIMRACSGTWIAHGSGNADRMVVDRRDRVRVPPDGPTYTLRRVWLDQREEDGYYYGFSNEGLWPLCHQAYVRPAFRESDWRAYQAVNDKFAQVVCAEASAASPIVLIQDFHFALLPGLIRRRRAEATIALFWHVPWPNAEIFGVCPWKRDLLQHMLAADILGFHTRYHCQNFLATVDRYVECQIDHEHMTVTHQGHTCQVVPYPISIEWPPRWLDGIGDVPTLRAKIRARHGIGADVRIGLGVERWDFTKGIVERFQALECLLERESRWRGRLTLLQVAAPSRSRLPAYQALQRQTLDEAERINARFATDTWKPIVLIGEHQEPREVFELYRAADFCLVNSLHDGMNLVAKEFVAARDDLDGVLILSTFAGASRELVEAILVNPFDVRETAAAIATTLDMGREERRERMRLMRRTVKENNVYRWAGRMLMDVARIRQRQALARWAEKL